LINLSTLIVYYVTVVDFTFIFTQVFKINYKINQLFQRGK